MLIPISLPKPCESKLRIVFSQRFSWNRELKENFGKWRLPGCINNVTCNETQAVPADRSQITNQPYDGKPQHCPPPHPWHLTQPLLTESLPQSCMALLVITMETSCQRTARSANSCQGLWGFRPLVSACSCRISSSSQLWMSQPCRRLRANVQTHLHLTFETVTELNFLVPATNSAELWRGSEEGHNQKRRREGRWRNRRREMKHVSSV